MRGSHALMAVHHFFENMVRSVSQYWITSRYALAKFQSECMGWSVKPGNWQYPEYLMIAGADDFHARIAALLEKSCSILYNANSATGLDLPNRPCFPR